MIRPVSIPSARMLVRGVWSPGKVHTRLVESTRAVVRVVEDAVDEAWLRESSRPGVALFDGPVCRLEAFDIEGDVLGLAVSKTSYRINVGTNFCNPHLADVFGPQVMANPVGVSCGLISADSFLMMGRRNGRVAYYPYKVHPFAGSVEVREAIDVFDDALRELREEIGLQANEITSIRCVGLAEDLALRHPESLFIAYTSRTREQIESSVHADEHGGSEAIRCEPSFLEAALHRDDLTPIAKAVVMRVRELGS
jgi:8-oxo-dGTP pyrophosphatase MutT (NUDIX family)